MPEAYNTNFGSGFAPRFAITSDVAYLNGNFDTWGIGHDLTIGSAGYRASSYSPITAAITTCPPTATNTCLGSANLADPVIYPEPLQGPPKVGSSYIYDSSDQYQQGFNLNDTLKFTESWLLRVGASQDWFHTQNFNNHSVPTTQYSDHGMSPSGSIIFKPSVNSSLYATYQNSLLAGDLAPAGTVDAGVSLPPYRTKQYEVGYKVDFDKINFTAALFEIKRPFANINPLNNVFEISGEQVNKGLELSAVGQLIEGLTMYGGITLLNSKLENTPLAATNDQPYVGTAKVKGNMLLEYHIRRIYRTGGDLRLPVCGPAAG